MSERYANIPNNRPITTDNKAIIVSLNVKFKNERIIAPSRIKIMANPVKIYLSIEYSFHIQLSFLSFFGMIIF